MNSNNSTWNAYDLFKLMFPQVVVFLTVMLSVYIGHKGHSGAAIFSSFYFLMFYGIVLTPVLLTMVGLFIMRFYGVDNDFVNSLFGVGSYIYFIGSPIIFCFLSSSFMVLLSRKSISKRSLKKIFISHLVIGVVLTVMVNFSFFKSEEFLEMKNLILHFVSFFITTILIFIVWGTLFEIVDRNKTN